jgi:hypothetical protein
MTEKTIWEKHAEAIERLDAALELLESAESQDSEVDFGLLEAQLRVDDAEANLEFIEEKVSRAVSRFI